MPYTFEHQLRFKDGTRGAVYRSPRRWQTAAGARDAAEKLVHDLDRHLPPQLLDLHHILVVEPRTERPDAIIYSIVA